VKLKVTAALAAVAVIATVGGVVSVPDVPPPQALKNKLAASAQADKERWLAIFIIKIFQKRAYKPRKKQADHSSCP
jgi:hypothetical protein